MSEVGQPAQPVTRAPGRPGAVLFAAVMMFVVAVFSLIAAIEEWQGATWLYQNQFAVSGHVAWWGFVDFGIALLSAFGGYLILTRHTSGRVLGCIYAGISAVRWMFYIPADPWLALAILAIDVTIIFGLCTAGAYFEGDEERGYTDQLTPSANDMPRSWATW